MPAASSLATAARRTETERRRLLELIRKSKGRPSNLTERERRRVRDLAAKALAAARKA